MSNKDEQDPDVGFNFRRTLQSITTYPYKKYENFKEYCECQREAVRDQIKELRELFDQLQIKSGISIPNAIEQKNIK
jgi:hypothetical protein